MFLCLVCVHYKRVYYKWWFFWLVYILGTVENQVCFWKLANGLWKDLISGSSLELLKRISFSWICKLGAAEGLRPVVGDCWRGRFTHKEAEQTQEETKSWRLFEPLDPAIPELLFEFSMSCINNYSFLICFKLVWVGFLSLTSEESWLI